MDRRRATIEFLGEKEDPGQMAEDVRAGLLSKPKDLSPWPKYLYDEKGRELVELGSGSASKTRTLLDAMMSARESVRLGAANGQVRYVPLDVSESALRDSARRLLDEYPSSLEISGFVGDFDRS